MVLNFYENFFGDLSGGGGGETELYIQKSLCTEIVCGIIIDYKG